MTIRTNITENEALKNMLELALFLEKNGDEGTVMSVDYHGLHMRFEAYTDVEEVEE